MMCSQVASADRALLALVLKATVLGRMICSGALGKELKVYGPLCTTKYIEIRRISDISS